LTSKVEDGEIGWKNAQQVELRLWGFQKSQFFFNTFQDTTRILVVEEVSASVVTTIIIVVIATPSPEVEAQQSIAN
jgi:hypothetical protein